MLGLGPSGPGSIPGIPTRKTPFGESLSFGPGNRMEGGRGSKGLGELWCYNFQSNPVALKSPVEENFKNRERPFAKGIGSTLGVIFKEDPPAGGDHVHSRHPDKSFPTGDFSIMFAIW